VQPASKPAIKKEAKAINKYTGRISHSRGNFISGAAAFASSLYHFQTYAMAIGFY
jgi:hypothetical protein